MGIEQVVGEVTALHDCDAMRRCWLFLPSLADASESAKNSCVNDVDRRIRPN